MSKLFATLLVLLGTVLPLAAEPDVPHGTFKVVNTEGFLQENGRRTALPVDTDIGSAQIKILDTADLRLTINATQIVLYRLEQGLAALDWNSDGTALLHAVDIQALLDKADSKDVPAWGATLDWPGLGDAKLVLLPLGENAFTGFLISRPGRKTVVRQMEFRKVFGPANRPEPDKDARNKGS